jgi:hypothetical protein
MFGLPSLIAISLSMIITLPAYCQDDDTRNILKQGLLGAGTGAIASGASGGNAGQGALIGAGTNVIGGALLDAITTPSGSSGGSYRRSAPPPQDYYEDQGDYYYEEPPQESGTQKVLKQGLLGAGTGAIASAASGGDAGKGALIGAGTNVIGGALLDAITTPSQPKRVYRRPPAQQYQPQYQQQYQPQPQQYQPQYQQQPQMVVQPQNVQVKEETVGSGDGRKKIIKKYDANGKLVSEEEIYF